MDKSKQIGIIDYGAGNTTSLLNAFQNLGAEARLTSDIKELKKCRALVVPGVGSFGQAMRSLKSNCLDSFIREQALQKKVILGICLGLQLFFSRSEEDESEIGLGLIPGRVVRFPNNLKVPHMGWNRLYLQNNPPFLSQLPQGSHFYFVHSYYVKPEEDKSIWGTANYGLQFPAIAGKDNIIGIQFHPEKSGPTGLKLLAAFLQYLADRGDKHDSDSCN